MISVGELAALDDWRFHARMPSRSSAVRELIRRGLAAEGYFDIAAAADQSSDFGILDRDGPPTRPGAPLNPARPIR